MIVRNARGSSCDSTLNQGGFRFESCSSSNVQLLRLHNTRILHICCTRVQAAQERAGSTRDRMPFAPQTHPRLFPTRLT